jgi:myosin VIIa
MVIERAVIVVVTADRSSFLTFQKGDLIVLEQDTGSQGFVNSSWCYGECLRTGLHGDFPAECVYVLPTITKPPPEILVSFNIRFLDIAYSLSNWYCMFAR